MGLVLRSAVSNVGQAMPRLLPTEVPASSSPGIAGDTVFVVEPLEQPSQLGRFLSAPAGEVMPTGECVNRWPLYGAIQDS